MMTEIIYGFAYACLFILGLAIIVLIAFRKQITRPITNLLRRVSSPPWNNWVFLGLMALTTILFLNAIYRGGGEPLGLQALKEVAKPEGESPIVKYYSDSVKYFTTGSEQPFPSTSLHQSKTWIWWKIAFGSLFVSIIFFPIAFWDEAARAWHRAQEILEQRPIRIQLRPTPQPQDSAQPAGQQPQSKPRPATHQSVWHRFRERFWASFSADMISETIFELGGQLLRRMIGGR